MTHSQGLHLANVTDYVNVIVSPAAANNLIAIDADAVVYVDDGGALRIGQPDVQWTARRHHVDGGHRDGLELATESASCAVRTLDELEQAQRRGRAVEG